ncbi:hypothetical protein [Massilia sp. erpn]|uniref:hypothetical protein n=1 Tax=Massilia sp. erpn TaxID=2738142 RepID=UPI00210788E0|nr:hypothetical protein [Massilia sp. erpn]UTY57891.1 hypothetical protein HPQ68_12285 [Massilia sp. erpn]
MMQNPYDEGQQLRAEIAATAARLIAQDGADYATAKRKAARLVLGEAQAQSRQSLLPDNNQIEEALRLYQSLFQGDTQPARLFRLRSLALQLMEELEHYHPCLTGAVLNGTAGPHDDIHLQLFADSAKEVQIFLLNKGWHIEISETPHFKGPRYDPVETASFLWRQEGVHLALYELDDLRGAMKPRSDGRPLRADLGGVRALLLASTHPSQEEKP